MYVRTHAPTLESTRALKLQGETKESLIKGDTDQISASWWDYTPKAVWNMTEERLFPLQLPAACMMANPH